MPFTSEPPGELPDPLGELPPPLGNGKEWLLKLPEVVAKPIRLGCVSKIVCISLRRYRLLYTN